MTRIAIITGSTRPGRAAPAVADWAHQQAATRTDAQFEIVDLADFELPLDEPVPALMSADYGNAHTLAWSTAITGFDGYVFVVPEYNHSMPASLKNAIDYLYQEWKDKAAGFVGYGTNGGLRAVEHLRAVMTELHVANVRDQVALSIFDDVVDGTITPRDFHAGVLHRMLDQVVTWSSALATLRSLVRSAH